MRWLDLHHRECARESRRSDQETLRSSCTGNWYPDFIVECGSCVVYQPRAKISRSRHSSHEKYCTKNEQASKCATRNASAASSGRSSCSTARKAKHPPKNPRSATMIQLQCLLNHTSTSRAHHSDSPSSACTPAHSHSALVSASASASVRLLLAGSGPTTSEPVALVRGC